MIEKRIEKKKKEIEKKDAVKIEINEVIQDNRYWTSKE